MSATPTIGFREGTTTDGQTFTTSSQTPTSGAVYTVEVHTAGTGGAVTPTLSGTGGWNVTWTAIQHINDGTPRGVTVFRGTAASGTAGTLTVDVGAGNTSTLFVVAAIAWSGVPAEASLVVQSPTATGSSTTPTVTLAAFASASNTAYWVFYVGETGDDPTLEGGWTAIGTAVTESSPNCYALSAYQIGNGDLTPSATTVSSHGWVAIALEIAASGGSTAVARIGRLVGEGGLVSATSGLIGDV